MTFLASLLAPFWRWIAALGALLALILGAFLKGQSVQKAKSELKDLKDANDIRKAGADARDRAHAGELHDDDGWKRRD